MDDRKSPIPDDPLRQLQKDQLLDARLLLAAQREVVPVELPVIPVHGQPLRLVSSRRVDLREWAPPRGLV